MLRLRDYLAAGDPSRSLFNAEEREFLAFHRSQPGIATPRTVAYSVYENRFGRAGGIFPVALNATGELNHHVSVVAFSPYHRSLKGAPKLPVALTFDVPFGQSTLQADLLEHVEANGVTWYLLSAEGFFDARGGDDGTNPYAHDQPGKLLLDSLFFCQALPRALRALGHQENVIVHAQDWEVASAALTVREALLARILKSASVVLTLHNSYDHGLTTELSLITERAFESEGAPDTVLGIMLPLLYGPLSTVSREFAQDLTHDPLQTAVFAPHLQKQLRQMPVVGVPNGFFGRDAEPFSASAMRTAERGLPQRILAEKAEKRKKLLSWLEGFRDPRQFGELTAGEDAPLSALDPRVPIFCMFGRLDPGQKGFDILLRAIEAWPKGSAKFILTPNTSGAPESYIEDFREVAAYRAGDVLVFPFRMNAGYQEILEGSSFSVFPSLFEPFGGASEAYFAGTPVIARATGGLIAQVVDLDEAPERSTGLLFREALSASPELELKQVHITKFPRGRQTVPIYQKMVQALSARLESATHAFQDEKVYGGMLSRVAAKARSFSWEATVKGYDALYDLSVI
ncbi:MAG: glycogen/starch synthase [Polyangiaceae bacterium]|nr:glycogen/starch synthase [Polyangiaceae bacterium]